MAGSRLLAGRPLVVAAGGNAWRSLRLRSVPLSDMDLDRFANWLILVPHPDDETLGAGALIAKLARMNIPAWVVFLTDGSASHKGAAEWPARRIAHVRRAEAGRALRALGAPGKNRLDLGWRDSHPYDPDAPDFKTALRRLAGLCKKENIRAIATTWRNEHHCDHKAANELAISLARELRGHAVLLEYLVWGWTDPNLLSEVNRRNLFALSDPHSVMRRKRAILCHRTQISPMISGAEEPFRLPREMIGLAGRDPAIFLRSSRRDAA